jgi:uncharacterized protein (TIGR00369 family)
MTNHNATTPSVDSTFLAPSTDDWSAWPTWASNLPASQCLGLRVTSVGPGTATAFLDESPWPLNPNQSVHGGLVAAAADQAGGIAAVAALGERALPATATLHAEYLRPAFPGLRLDCRVVRGGRTLLFVEIDVLDRKGQLCTKFNGTWSVSGAVPSTRTEE